jgi:nitroimidazol reductase NimA-like FMN-containing flavoprotein (pyridoxamine 5'-phosphate oxidase superfamily)
MSLRMSKDQREAFLSDLHVGVISVEQAHRAPLSAPIWYDYDSDIGVWVLTQKASRKGVLLEAAGRYSLVAQTEKVPYQYVSVEGPIVEVRPSDKEQDLRRMARRYLGPTQGDAYTESLPEGGSFVYVMRPERWLTVDYSKLPST